MTGVVRAMVGMGLLLLLFLYVGASKPVNFRRYKHHVSNCTGLLQLARWPGTLGVALGGAGVKPTVG